MGLGGKVRRKEKKAREERKEDGMSRRIPVGGIDGAGDGRDPGGGVRSDEVSAVSDTRAASTVIRLAVDRHVHHSLTGQVVVCSHSVQSFIYYAPAVGGIKRYRHPSVCPSVCPMAQVP